MPEIVYPVILAGGSGTRLWPLSREHYPKQLLSLTGEKSLLQQTVLRLDGLHCAEPLLICNEEYRYLIDMQMKQINREVSKIILEPGGHNTAPAATLAALYLAKIHAESLMLLIPSDHILKDQEAFYKAVQEATVLAREGRVVAFAVPATSAETGYGYIRCGENNVINEFIEKPDQNTAQSYIDSGEYCWNGGIFMVRADVFLAEIERFEPAILLACSAAYDYAIDDGIFLGIATKYFDSCPSNSIDYVVMEKNFNSAFVKLEAGWSDVGSWSTLWRSEPCDEYGNLFHGDVVANNTHNTMVIAQHRLVATIGLEDIIVIETPDAVLVTNSKNAANVREVVNKLKQDARREYLDHRRVFRPWGSHERVDAGERFQVKRLIVQPGAALSLQMHYHRAEHWVVVRGTARITCGEDIFVLTENQSTYIPLGTKHRLENPGTIPLEIIEVQSGAYLGEDDIIRFQDIYNRPVEAIARAC